MSTKLGTIKNAETGEVIVEMLGPPNALSNGDALSGGLYSLSELVTRALIPDAERGGLGGRFGYGANFENEVFMMHPYCWCESDDCMWCGGSSCQVGVPDEVHRSDCYQERLQELRKQFGEQADWTEKEYFHVPYGSPNQKKYDAAKKALCKELRQSYKSGNEMHCTCGVVAERKARYDACQCDWHLGRGIFRFGAAAEAPHFWHKASGLQVRWYKWIGRDMEVNKPDLTVSDWCDILKQCYESIPKADRDRAEAEAKADAEREADPEYQRQHQEGLERMFRAMQAAHDQCEREGHDDPDGHCHRCGLVTNLEKWRSNETADH